MSKLEQVLQLEPPHELSFKGKFHQTNGGLRVHFSFLYMVVIFEMEFR